MKIFPLLLLTFLMFPAHSDGEPIRLELLPGIEITEYPRHVEQSDDSKAFLETEKLGEPIGKQVVTKSVSPWNWNRERNAVARGFLKIDKDGEYAFTSNGYYDRNLLKIDGKVVCGFRDGTSRIVTLALKKGLVPIEVVGYVESRGSAEVRWRPPGQRELSAIPPGKLKHHGIRKLKKKAKESDWVATSLAVVAKDFVLEVYRNGKRVPDSKRKLLLDRFGATAERIDVKVREGDWLVFQVAHNRLRHGGTKYFGLAGALGDEPFAIVSDPESKNWSSCDNSEQAAEFIRNREYGTGTRALAIEKPWEEGLKFMTQYAGKGFSGKSLWGEGPSTWVKLVVPARTTPRLDPIIVGPLEADSSGRVVLKVLTPIEPEPEEEPKVTSLPIENPKQWPVQILSAIYGTGGKNANVTEKVKQLVEVERKFFAANPGHLGVDPNPYWNKILHIVYMKDGVRREQRRNENEHILPESFYGPQDAAELAEWLAGTRWKGPDGELQFHANGTATGAHLKRPAGWESLDKNWVRLKWSEDEKTDFNFDYWWRSFSEPKNAENSYHIAN